MNAAPQDVGPGGGETGPTNPTPLALAFYAAFKASGMTLDALARRADVSLPTVSAYINGTRGGGGQARARPTIVAIAKALDMDVDRTLKLAGLHREAGVIESIRADSSLSKKDKEMFILLYEQRRRR